MICHRHRAISLLFGYDPALLDFLFTPSRQRLAQGRRALQREALLLGEQRRVLVKIALVIWSGKGQRLLGQWPLEPHHIEALQAARAYLSATIDQPCQHCTCPAPTGRRRKPICSEI